jgi:hypothetical protein
MAPDRPGKTTRQVLLPLPGPIETIAIATEFKSTWLVSSLEGLRCNGHFERYLQALEAHHDEILTCVAGSWLSIAVVRSHYEACERLALSPEELETMARSGGSVRRAWHAALIAATERPGSSIWTILPQLHKLWLRSANGGAAAVVQTGSHAAEVEYVGCELFDIAYFREAVRAVLLLLGEHMCNEISVDSLPSKEGQAAFRMKWRSTKAEQVGR